MEAKELMIGDWVNWHTYSDRPHYCKVTQIAYDPRIEGSDNFDCEPILITPEILENNGFKEVSDNIFENEEHCVGIDHTTGEMVFYKYQVCDMETGESKLTDMIRFIFNVHQLQQALRLCGLSEIADNFKI